MDKLEYDGKTLTKRQALFICYKMWEWLADTGAEFKDTWPEWVHNGGKIHVMLCFCACCEHRRISNKRCFDCLLLDLWPNGCANTAHSPYVYWDNARTVDERKKYARIITDYAKAEYNKLIEQEN